MNEPQFLTIYSTTIVIEIQFEDNGIPSELTFEINEQKKEQTAIQLLSKLRNCQFIEFEDFLVKIVARNHTLDRLGGLHPKLNSILFTFQDDIQKIYRHQSRIHSNKECLFDYCGIVVEECEGLRVNFHIQPKDDQTIQTLVDRPSDLRFGSSKCYFGVIEVSEGDRPVPLGSQSSIQELKANGSVVFFPSPQDPCLIPIRFLFKLSQELILSTTLLNEIRSLTGVKPYCVMPAGYSYFSLMGSTLNTQSHIIDNHMLVCVNAQSESPIIPRALRVLQLAFYRPSDLFQILPLLRQQITFNELFSSCFHSQAQGPRKRKHEQLETGSEKRPLSVEIFVEPPSKFGIKLLDAVPIEIRIDIGLNGHLNGLISNCAKVPSSQSCENQFMEDLRSSHDVPGALVRHYAALLHA